MQFIDWFDTTLGIPCFFGLSEDGVLRCLPVHAATTTIRSLPSTFFDPACTQLAVVGSPLTHTPYVTLQDAACPGDLPVQHVYTLREAGPIVTTLYSLHGSTCTGMPPPTGEVVLAIAPADLSTFVTAQVVKDSHGPLDVEVIVADDGARQLGRTIDHGRGAPCGTGDFVPDNVSNSVAAEIALARCPPANIGMEVRSDYDQADCTGVMGGAWGCPSSCPAPQFGIGSMAGTYDLIALEPTATGAYWLDPTGQCEADTSSTCSFYPETSAADLSLFPPITTGQLGTGRLTRPVFVSPLDGHVVANRPWGFWDTERGVNCRPTAFVDGIERCVGDDVALLYPMLFTDAACTQQVVLVGSSGPPPYACEPYLNSAGSYLGIVSHVFAVGGPVFSGAPLYVLDGSGVCQPSALPANEEFAFVGAEVDPDSAFARLTEEKQ